MSKPIELRFIPLWLKRALSYYNANHDNLGSIVSKEDIRLYKVANNILRSKLVSLGIKDFILPDAEISEGFSQEDAVFALYGQNKDQKDVGSYALDRFCIVPDKYDGIVLYEDVSTEPAKLLVEELVKSVALYRGKEAAYASDSFKQFLVLVNKNTVVQRDEPKSAAADESSKDELADELRKHLDKKP